MSLCSGTFGAVQAAAACVLAELQCVQASRQLEVYAQELPGQFCCLRGGSLVHEHQLHYSSSHYFLHSTCLPTLASQGAILPAASCGHRRCYIGMQSLESAQVAVQAFTEESMAFQTKMVANGGLGQETYLPEGKPSSPHLFSIRYQHDS